MPTPPTQLDPLPELRHPHRAALIRDLEHIIANHRLDSVTWACLWLADIEVLREMVEGFQDPHTPLPEDAGRRDPLYPYINTLRLWAIGDRQAESKDRIPSQVPTHDVTAVSGAVPANPRPTWGSPYLLDIESIRRSNMDAGASLCAKRDKNTCLVTRARDCVRRVYICPLSLELPRAGTRLAEFWDELMCFWCYDRVGLWKYRLSCYADRDVCENLMTLSPTAASLWVAARFTLKPEQLSEDRRMLKVRFFWLPETTYRKEVDDLTQPPCISIDRDCSGGGTLLPDCEARWFIRSGEILVFRTDDPDRAPLPSIWLLEMQWFLHRVLALSGVGKEFEKELESGLAGEMMEESETEQEDYDEDEDEDYVDDEVDEEEDEVEDEDEDDYETADSLNTEVPPWRVR